MGTKMIEPKKYNLLGHPEKLVRDVSIRLNNKEKNRQNALKFGIEYFDGSREEGYGGYVYDGRWVPVAANLIRRYNLDSTSKFLDVGCAKGFLLYDLYNTCPGLQVFGLDISNYAKDKADVLIRDKIKIGNCNNLPYPDNFFDASVSINTIHNLNYEGCKAAIKELIRVTKNKENIFVQVDSYENENEKKIFEDWMLTAETYLKPKDWVNLFKECDYQGDYFWTIISFN